MPLTNVRKSKELVFTNKDFTTLLLEIVEYFKNHPMEEAQKYLEDMVLTYNPEIDAYIATVYLMRGEWDGTMP